VCISEILFTNYFLILKRIEEEQPHSDVVVPMNDERCLAIFAVKPIDQLIYLDSLGVRVNYGGQLSGTMLINPDPVYEPFRSLSDKLREERRRGVMYPSARHSEDLCLALFEDETSKIKKDVYDRLVVILRLVSESQDPKLLPTDCDPFEEKLHSTMGYYSFPDTREFNKLQKAGLIHPKGMPSMGMVDFVRRRYIAYPQDAVL